MEKSSHVDIPNDGDEDLSIDNTSTEIKKTDVDPEKTVTKKKYYCNLCATGGWEKQVSLSQHMRHMRKSEFNATIEVPLKKRRWTHDEMLVLAELDTNLPYTKGMVINSVLAKNYPSRSREAIKLRRQTPGYKKMLLEVRQDRALSNCEGSDCTEKSSDVDTATAANGSINETEDENDPLERL